MGELQRIRIGNQTATTASSITEPFEYAISSGFDAFEWFPDKKETGAGWEERDINEGLRASIKERARQHDIALSVHAPWQTNPLLPGGCDRLLETVAFARDIGARLLNVHFYVEKGVEAYLKAIIPLVRRTAELGLQLSVENIPQSTPYQCNELFARLDDFAATGIDHVGMCLDIGHANLCNATHNDYLKFLDLLEPDLCINHLHLHENFGDYDSHLCLFTGPAGRDPAGITGLIDRLRQRDFSGCVILEQWPQPAVLLDNARDRLSGMFTGTAQPSSRPGVLTGHAIVSAIAEANTQFHSWRRRLAWVHDFLLQNAPLTHEQLIYVAIYLRFIGTGEIPCLEDGGHFRPSNHARISREIHEVLGEITAPEAELVLRKIYPWLPSFSGQFAGGEPLTRIRDIAHRNDIPHDLKREIKVTLQNKLHRSAGPEDLATSEALLKRITAQGAAYPQTFVEEFKRFHEELGEFFNARSLEEDLVAMARAADDRKAALIRQFLEAKAKLGGHEQQRKLLDLLTQLRSLLREEYTGRTDARAQEARQLDIKLEGFAFVVLSQLATFAETPVNRLPWPLFLHALLLGVANIRLSGFEHEECAAIESELRSVSQRFTPTDRDDLLQLRSLVERCSRLIGLYSDGVLSFFPEKVEALGRALGVDEHARMLFAEADIRSNPVFQLSRLVAIAQAHIRTLAGLPPWDIIVPGKVNGRLVAARGLGELPSDGASPEVLLLENAEGDEHIPTFVAGIIMPHDIPHLSHLAIRARQRGVVFVVSEDTRRWTELRRAIGMRCILDASAEDVEIREEAGAGVQRQPNLQVRRKPIEVPDVLLTSAPAVLSLGKVTARNAGRKAVSARRLGELSRSSPGEFKTPAGVVVPFGVMEQCLHAKADIEREYRALVEGLDRLPPSEFENGLTRIRDLIFQLQVPPEILAGVMKNFKPDSRLMVRSSANAEDLADFAGAGLFESVANIPISEIARAIRRVWSSLWGRRAAFSRRECGIPHARVHMAVLIQQMLDPDLSFIVHTINPVSHNPGEVYMELAVGLGEVLTSGEIPGSPYRMVYRKGKNSVELRAHASFSLAVAPSATGGVVRRTIDYSRVRFTTDREYRRTIGRRLGEIGAHLETVMSQPQDVEGTVIGDTIFLVQTRVQQAISPA